MRAVIYVFSVLLIIAAGFVVESSYGGLSPLYDLFVAQPWEQRAAWVLLLAAVIGVLAIALWQSDKVAQQRKAIDALEKRVGLKSLENPQSDIEQVSSYLSQSDPDDAVNALKERLAEAGRTAALQESRNEAPDFERRVEDIRNQQYTLRDRLGDVVTKRRAVDQVIAELRRQQQDIERSLEEFDRGEGKADFKSHVKDLLDFVGETRARLNEVERAQVTLEELKGGFGEFQDRITRLEASQGGIKELSHEVRNLSERLSGAVERLEWDHDMTLKDRVQKLTEKKQDLDRRLLVLGEEFASLESIRQDVSGLFARMNESLTTHLPSQQP